MGGRLLDWLGQGDAADRPLAVDVPTLVPTGSAVFYYAKDTKILSVYDEDDADWFDIDASALSTLAFATLPDVDFSTPPTDEQVFVWDTTSSKLIPYTLQYQDVADIMDDISVLIVQGAGINLTYLGGILTIASTITQYTDEMAQDAVAAALAAGTHVGIAVNYNDPTNKFDLTLTSIDAHTDVDLTGIIAGQGIVWDGAKFVAGSISGYSDEQARDAIAAMLAAGTHTGLTVTNNDGADSMSLALVNPEATISKPVAASFTLENGGTASVADGTNGVVLTVPSATVNARFLRYTAGLPGASWVCTIRVNQCGINAGTLHAGAIIVRNSTSGRLLTFGETNNTNLGIGRWSSYTANNAVPVSLAAHPAEQCWRRVTSNGTTLTFETSCDGREWATVGTETIATYLTASGGTLDQIGMGVFIGAAAGATMKNIFQHFSLV
jgi:hypothetical protein